MINKTQTISALGRRNPQQILKDFARPAPASTVSGPNISYEGGYGGGNIPGCAGGEGPEQRTSCGDQSDDFDRNVAIGWGGSGGGFDWTYILDPADSNMDAGATLAGGDTASVVGTGGRLSSEPTSFGTTFGGAAVAAHIPYDNVNDEYEILIRLSWSELGDTADAGTQHAINFAHRGPDEESGTADDVGYDLTENASSYVLSNGVRIIWKEFPARGLPNDYITIFGGGTAATTPIVTGAEYYLRIRSGAHSAIASFWRSDQEESSAAQVIGTRALTSPVYPPGIGIMNAQNFQPHDTIADAMRSTVYVHSVIVNPVQGLLTCNDPSDSPGVYIETLYRKQYYWRPQVTNVSYYRNVWFDGIPAQQGVHYTIEDGYKIVPTDFELPTDTVVEAEIVVE